MGGHTHPVRKASTSWGVSPWAPSPCCRWRNQGAGAGTRASALGEGLAGGRVAAAVCSHPHTDARLRSPGSCTPPQGLAITAPQTPAG